MSKLVTPLAAILVSLAMCTALFGSDCQPTAWTLYDQTQTIQSLNWKISFNAAIITTRCELDSLTPQEHAIIRAVLKDYVKESGFLVLHVHSSDWYKQRIIAKLNEALEEREPVYDILLFDLSGAESL